MAEQNANRTREQTATVVKRRGMLAAAWAAVATIVAKRTTEPVGAATTDTNFVANGTVSNFDARGNAPVGLATDSGTFNIGVSGVGSSTGVRAKGGLYGLEASAPGNYGIGVTNVGQAITAIASSRGIEATVDPSTSFSGTIGLYGLNYCSGKGGMGVRGTIPDASAAASTVAVYGENLSTNTGGAPGAGGYGVYGYSVHGHGVIGGTVGPGGGGIVGSTFGVPGVWAGLFFGPLAVVGGAKSAAVANGDGTHSLLYCVESPESWFEDFGKAALECGRAEVTIDPAFAAVADLTDYHVFLTAHDHHQLAVVAQTPTTFRVEANLNLARLEGRQESDLTGTFSWRLVAKRKDVAAPRLARIQLPPAPKHTDVPAPATPFRPTSLPG